MRSTGPQAAAQAPAPMCDVEPVDGFDAARADWTALAPATGNVFSSWEYATAWWRHAADGCEPWLYRVRDADGRVAALIPLCRGTMRGLPVVRFIGHGVADELGVVCAPADRAMAAAGLREVLKERRGTWDVLLIDHARADAGWAGELGGRVVRTEPSPLLRIAGTPWAELEQGFSRSMRKTVARRERRLQREHDLTMRLCDDPERLDADLDALFRLHDARWAAGESVAFSGTRRDLHRDLAAVMLERGWLRLWIADADGHPAAAWYGFRFAGVDSFYQSGRDPRFDQLSIGSVLMWHTIRAAGLDGQDEFRLLRGGEAYKSKLASDDAPVQTVAVAGGPRGRVLLAVAGAMSSRPATRRLVRRFMPDGAQR